MCEREQKNITECCPTKNDWACAGAVLLGVLEVRVVDGGGLTSEQVKALYDRGQAALHGKVV